MMQPKHRVKGGVRDPAHVTIAACDLSTESSMHSVVHVFQTIVDRGGVKVPFLVAEWSILFI